MPPIPDDAAVISAYATGAALLIGAVVSAIASLKALRTGKDNGAAIQGVDQKVDGHLTKLTADLTAMARELTTVREENKALRDMFIAAMSPARRAADAAALAAGQPVLAGTAVVPAPVDPDTDAPARTDEP